MRSTSRPAILPAFCVASRCELLKYAGTVMTALVTFSPRRSEASSTSLRSTIAEISSGVYCLSPTTKRTPPSGPLTTSYGARSASSRTSSQVRPMKRLTSKSVPFGFSTAWRLATWPTRRWSSLNATTDGVVRLPSEFTRTLGSPPSMTAMTLFVVPRSMPTALAISGLLARDQVVPAPLP